MTLTMGTQIMALIMARYCLDALALSTEGFRIEPFEIIQQ
jgi:hypothetical protein